MTRLRCWTLWLHLGALAPLIPDLSKLLSLATLLRLFTPRRPSRLYAGIRADEIVAAVERRLRNPWRMRGRRCLRKGLLTFYFLRLAGIPAVLNFGVYRVGGSRERAHCWVTIGGKVVSDPPEHPFVLLLAHGAEGPWPAGAAKAAA